MDADGIPLYSIKHWQKALRWGQVCGQLPRITLFGLHPTISG